MRGRSGRVGSGIEVVRISSFAGDIANSGTISAGFVGIEIGIDLQRDISVVGDVVNSGTITAKTGIAVLGGSTIFGAIVDSGTMRRQATAS